jgi:hypothetical protein
MVSQRIHDYYFSTIQKIKYVGGSRTQAMGLCPFHEDTTPSFSMCLEAGSGGKCNCKACSWKGNCYHVAKALGHPEPHIFIEDEYKNNDERNHYQSVKESRGLTQTTKPPNSVIPNAPKPEPVPKPKYEILDLDEAVAVSQKELKDNMDWWHEQQYDYVYDIDRFMENGGGVMKKRLQFAQHDWEGNVVCVQVHKGAQHGWKKCKWYFKHLIAKHDHDKDLFVCEGLKDANVLDSYSYQVTSGTAGAGSIPKNKEGEFDLEFLKYYNAWIYIIYDNDKQGYRGAQYLADKIVEKHSHLKVAIAQWNEDCPEGHDVFDAFMENPAQFPDFQDAIMNAKQVEYKLPERYGGLKFTSGLEALTIETAPTKEIIECWLPENQQILFAGTEKANKSMLCMQMMLTMANKEDSFLGFKIYGEEIRILYVDTEVGKKTFDYRVQMIAKGFSKILDDTHTRFNYLSQDKKDPHIYNEIDKAIIQLRPDIVIIDCLYNTTGGIDMRIANQLSEITDRITELKWKHDITIPCIHHYNKGNEDAGLVNKRVQGASNLLFWMEHSVYITKTNEPLLRLLKFGDTRSIAVPDDYYLLEFDPQTFSMSMHGIVKDWKKYIISAEKKQEYDYYLSFMDDEFTTNDWHEIVVDKFGTPKRTSENWLSHCAKSKMIIRPAGSRYGIWRKHLDIIEPRGDNDDEETSHGGLVDSED